MKHGICGPHGIVHGMIPAQGDEARGWFTVCYPRGGYAGGEGVYGKGNAPPMEPEFTEKPITCRRCLRRLGRTKNISDFLPGQQRGER